ncbi:unnamed protein product, partial [marine sediment metagenome]
ELAEQCRLLRHHGEPEWYVYNRLGYNYRMTEIQAAIGRVQLRKLDSFITIRNKNAKYLSEATSNLKGINPPFVPEYCEPAFNYWIGRLDPDVLGITKTQFLDRFPRSKVLYPKPLYKTKLFQKKIAYTKGCPWSCPFYGKETNYDEVYLPIVEKVTQEIFALDIHPKVTTESLDDSIETMKKITENKE